MPLGLGEVWWTLLGPSPAQVGTQEAWGKQNLDTWTLLGESCDPLALLWSAKSWVPALQAQACASAPSPATSVCPLTPSSLLQGALLFCPCTDLSSPQDHIV